MKEELTSTGCKLTRDFSLGEGYGGFSGLLEKGYRELYYDAPYHWGVLHPEKKRILTFTEGDINRIQCDTKKQLIDEATRHVDYMRDQGEGMIGEWPDLLKQLKAMKEPVAACPAGPEGRACRRRQK